MYQTGSLHIIPWKLAFERAGHNLGHTPSLLTISWSCNMVHRSLRYLHLWVACHFIAHDHCTKNIISAPGSHTFHFQMKVPMGWGIPMGLANLCSTLTDPPNIPWPTWWVWVYHGCGCGYDHWYPGIYPHRSLLSFMTTIHPWAGLSPNKPRTRPYWPLKSSSSMSRTSTLPP